jgi:hypothetical protein
VERDVARQRRRKGEEAGLAGPEPHAEEITRPAARVTSGRVTPTMEGAVTRWLTTPMDGSPKNEIDRTVG